MPDIAQMLGSGFRGIRFGRCEPASSQASAPARYGRQFHECQPWRNPCRDHLAALLRHCTIAAFLLLPLVGCDNRPASNTNKPLRIGITQIATHPGIDAIRKGFIDEMARLGHQEGKDVAYDQSNAQGDMPTAQSIAQKLAQERCDLIFAISTPSAQTVAQAIKGTAIPLVFGAV